MKPRHQSTNINRIASQDETAVADKFQEELMESQAPSHEARIGKVFRTDALLDQELEYISDGIDDSGNEYELYLGRISRSPIVKSIRTGKCFLLPWSEVIRLAERAGVNE